MVCYILMRLSILSGLMQLFSLSCYAMKDSWVGGGGVGKGSDAQTEHGGCIGYEALTGKGFETGLALGHGQTCHPGQDTFEGHKLLPRIQIQEDGQHHFFILGQVRIAQDGLAEFLWQFHESFEARFTKKYVQGWHLSSPLQGLYTGDHPFPGGGPIENDKVLALQDMKGKGV